MQWRTEREPNRETSPPPVKEMQGCRLAFKTRAAGIAEKTLGLSLACLVISLHCQLFTAEVQFLTRINPVSMVRAALGAELS
jgi:hypothetical protein